MNGGSNISGLENITTVRSLPSSSVALRFLGPRSGTLGTAAGGGLISILTARVPCTAPVPGGVVTFFDTKSVTPASVAGGGHTSFR